MKNFTNYKEYDKKENLKVGSKVVHGAVGHDPFTGSVSFPIFQTATFRFRGLEDSFGYDYTRLQNPTIEELERTLAMLEEGTHALALSSGMAAVMCVFSLLKSGDHLISSDDIYGGTYEIAKTELKERGVETSFVDLSDFDLFKESLRENTKMIFIESPTNPTMKVADIAEICKVAKEKEIIVVVDNTLLTPYYQKPLTLGADIVIHSGTKYLEGHNDTMAGFVVTNKDEYFTPMRSFLTYQGACLAPLNAWLTLRGIKTLEVRMQRHNENALLDQHGAEIIALAQGRAALVGGHFSFAQRHHDGDHLVHAFVGLGVQDGQSVDVKIPGRGGGLHLLGIAHQDDVHQVVLLQPGGGFENTLVGALGEHDGASGGPQVFDQLCKHIHCICSSK